MATSEKVNHHGFCEIPRIIKDGNGTDLYLQDLYIGFAGDEGEKTFYNGFHLGTSSGDVITRVFLNRNIGHLKIRTWNRKRNPRFELLEFILFYKDSVCGYYAPSNPTDDKVREISFFS